MTDREKEKNLMERASKLAEALGEIPLEDALFVFEIASAILARRDAAAENEDRGHGESWKAPT